MSTRHLSLLVPVLYLHLASPVALTAQTGTPSQSPLTVAVADFDAVGLQATDSWIPDAVEEGITDLLIRSGSVTVVERRYLLRLMEELALQISGAVSSESRVEIGNLLGASLLVAGSVEMRAGTLHITARLLDVETSGIRNSFEASGAPESLSRLELDLASRIMAALRLEEGARRLGELTPPPLPPLLRTGLLRAGHLAEEAPLIGLDPGRRRRQGDYLMAVDLVERVLAESPSSAEAYVIRGTAWLNLDDAGTASASYREAITISPTNVQARLGLANALFVLRLNDQAIETAREAVALAPRDGRARYVLGRILYEGGQRAEAAAALLETLERSPIPSGTENTLRVILGGTQHDQIMQALEAMGDGLAPAARLMQALWTDDRLPDRDDVETVQRLRPGFYPAFYWAGLLARRDRRPDDAERLFRQALSLNPTFPLVHRELGRLALERDRCREGEQHVRLYLQTAEFVNDFDELNQLIEKCKLRNPPPVARKSFSRPVRGSRLLHQEASACQGHTDDPHCLPFR